MAVSVAATRSLAQQGVPLEPTRVTYRAPAGCGSAEDFSERLRERLPRLRLVTEGTASRLLAIEIDAAGGRWRGKVTITDMDGATRARALEASSCEETLAGLSLIAAVTLDPDSALSEPEAKPEPAAEPEPAAPERARPPPALPPRRPSPPAASMSARESYRLSFGAGGSALMRFAPEPAWGGHVALAFELQAQRFWSPLGRLSVAHVQLRDLTVGPFEAGFAYTLPTLEVCPARIGPRAFGIRPCAFVSAGLLKVWGEGGLRNETHERFFGEAGAGLLSGLRLGEVFEIIVDARAGLPFEAHRFAFDGMAFFTTPPVGFASSLGLSGGFP